MSRIVFLEIAGVRVTEHEDGRISREDCTLVFRGGVLEGSFTLDEKVKALTQALSPDVVSITVEFKSDQHGDDAAFFEITISDEIAADLCAETGKHERWRVLSQRLREEFGNLDLGGRFPYTNYRSVSETKSPKVVTGV